MRLSIPSAVCRPVSAGAMASRVEALRSASVGCSMGALLSEDFDREAPDKAVAPPDQTIFANSMMSFLCPAPFPPLSAAMNAPPSSRCITMHPLSFSIAACIPASEAG
jgi:hypothetical protein